MVYFHSRMVMPYPRDLCPAGGETAAGRAGALDPGTLAGPAVAGRAGDKLAVGPRSVVVLRSPRPQE